MLIGLLAAWDEPYNHRRPEEQVLRGWGAPESAHHRGHFMVAVDLLVPCLLPCSPRQLRLSPGQAAEALDRWSSVVAAWEAAAAAGRDFWTDQRAAGDMADLVGGRVDGVGRGLHWHPLAAGLYNNTQAASPSPPGSTCGWLSRRMHHQRACPRCPHCTCRRMSWCWSW